MSNDEELLKSVLQEFCPESFTSMEPYLGEMSLVDLANPTRPDRGVHHFLVEFKAALDCVPVLTAAVAALFSLRDIRKKPGDARIRSMEEARVQARTKLMETGLSESDSDALAAKLVMTIASKLDGGQ